MTSRGRVATVTGAAVGALLLSGCAGGGDAGPATPGSAAASGTVVTTQAPPESVAPSPSPSASAVQGVEPAPSASATEKINGPAPTTNTGGLAAAVVKEIRAADHGTFDRVVIEYTGSFGAWSVGYVDKVVNDPIGDDVPLKGQAFLDVRVDKATFNNLFQVGGGIEHIEYAGPHRLAPTLGNVQEIADAGDFEAQMGLGIGVNHKAGVRAYRLNNPARLVIDVAH